MAHAAGSVVRCRSISIPIVGFAGVQSKNRTVHTMQQWLSVAVWERSLGASSLRPGQRSRILKFAGLVKCPNCCWILLPIFGEVATSSGPLAGTSGDTVASGPLTVAPTPPPPAARDWTAGRPSHRRGPRQLATAAWTRLRGGPTSAAVLYCCERPAGGPPDTAGSSQRPAEQGGSVDTAAGRQRGTVASSPPAAAPAP